MKALLFMIFLLSLPSGGIKTISRLNQYSAEAADAYREQNYIKAITAYEYILNELEIKDDQLRLNLAHSYFKANLLKQALEQYDILSHHPSNHVSAVAHLQLGNIEAKNKKYKKALGLFKRALLADPSNESARYNYELINKYLLLHPDKAEAEEKDTTPNNIPPPPPDEALQPKQKPDAKGNSETETDITQPDNQGRHENNPAQEKEREQTGGKTKGDTEGQNNTGDPSDEQPQQQAGSENISETDTRAQMQRERLRQANLSPEKARLLLDAMRHSELQYIQQLPKKATKKPEKGKPNW
jgi:tetratricopeptide (TPR) repeat protein